MESRHVPPASVRKDARLRLNPKVFKQFWVVFFVVRAKALFSMSALVQQFIRKGSNK